MKITLALSLALLLGACTPDAGEPSIAGLRGNWVLVNYWAEWCKPCIKEVPELNELDRKNADISVLGVNYDGVSGQALADQVEKLGIDFPTLPTDPSAELAVPRPTVLPTTLVIDPRGEVREVMVGPQTLDSLEQAVDALRAAG